MHGTSSIELKRADHARQRLPHSANHKSTKFVVGGMGSRCRPWSARFNSILLVPCIGRYSYWHHARDSSLNALRDDSPDTCCVTVRHAEYIRPKVITENQRNREAPATPWPAEVVLRPGPRPDALICLGEIEEQGVEAGQEGAGSLR